MYATILIVFASQLFTTILTASQLYATILTVFASQLFTTILTASQLYATILTAMDRDVNVSGVETAKEPT